jgi:carboxypeptidase Q
MRTYLLPLLMFAVACVAAAAQSSSDKIIEESLKPSSLGTNLQQLTDRVGGRVPGTPAFDQAVAWAEAAFKAAGADSVHTEQFKIAQSWAEGATEFEITAPNRFRVRAVSVAWAPALKQTQARVIDVGEGTVKEFAAAGDISGAILLVHTDVLKTWDDLFAEYLKAPPIIDQAVKGRALAIAFMATRWHDILYRHTNSSDGHIDKLPMLVVSREDGERVARLIASGKKIQAEISIPNRIGGPITTSNVIAELRGSEKADEFVILGAHLDSWELGTGALDDGCNAALVIDAFRAIKASGLKPRRSVRFVLFSGEEEGLLGSWAYARAHRADLDKMAGAVIFDAGTGRVTGFSLGARADEEAAVKQLIAPLAQWNATELTMDAPWGTDNVDFLLEGVPTLVANQETANYLENYHAVSDTYDKVDFPQLKKHVAMAAEATFAIADAPERIAPRQNRAEIEQLLKQSGLGDQLKIFGMWAAWENGERGRAK